MAQTYLDFLIEIGAGDGLTCPIAVRSYAGEARTASVFPFTAAELENLLLKVENALLRAGGQRRTILTPEEDAVRTFGQQLFDFLLTGEPRSLYYECAREASHQGKGMRVKLSIQSPTLAVLPWEFLYDPRKRDYVCLDPNTPLMRYTELAQTVPPLPVTSPLRILGMVAAPTDLQRLDVAQEQLRVTTAVQALQNRGLVELTWLGGQTWRDLQQIMRPGYGPWHILHFIGHGLFDALRDEGRIALADEQGHADFKSATQVARLLAHQRSSLRLVVLNTCEGARGGKLDPLASTAATLIQSGLPAVLAMQYAITNVAAIEFARTFYEALGDNLPVDAAVADARNAINNHDETSLEWGTPVLYMRAADGVLFAVDAGKEKRKGAEGQRRKEEQATGGRGQGPVAPLDVAPQPDAKAFDRFRMAGWFLGIAAILVLAVWGGNRLVQRIFATPTVAPTVIAMATATRTTASSTKTVASPTAAPTPTPTTTIVPSPTSNLATRPTNTLMPIPTLTLVSLPMATATSVTNMNALINAARQEGTLNVIALPHDWCNYGEVLDGFKKKYGLTINENNPDAGSGDEIEAVKANKDNKGSQAPDVIDVGFPFGLSAKTDGLIQPYKVSTWDSIPADAKDPDGYWYGDYYGVLSFMVNTDVIRTVPQDWSDLLKPDYANAVGLSGDPRTSNQAIQTVFAAALANGGTLDDASKGLDFFAQLNKAGNLVSVISNNALVAKGETGVHITWDYLALAGKDAMKGNPSIEVVIPKTGRFAGIYVQAISAYAPHPNAAKLWMEYLYSDESQLTWLKGYCHPIRQPDLEKRNVIPADLLKELPSVEGAVFPSAKQLDAAKKLITEGWDKTVGVNIKPAK